MVDRTRIIAARAALNTAPASPMMPVADSRPRTFERTETPAMAPAPRAPSSSPYPLEPSPERRPEPLGDLRSDVRAWLPECDDEPVEEERRGVEGKDRPDPEVRDQDPGQRRSDNPGDIDVDGAELYGRGDLGARDELRHERLVGGGSQDRTRADHEGEHEQEHC